MRKFTIFGLAGTGTSTVGKLLAKKANYKFISTGDIFRIKADKLKMKVYDFIELCKKNPKYDTEVDEYIKEFGAKNDNFVIESRLAYRFVPDSIKIKLTCDWETRTGRIAERESESVDEVRKKTSTRESADSERYERLYGIKELAPDRMFDLIIDTSGITAESVVDKIMRAFQLPSLRWEVPEL